MAQVSFKRGTNDPPQTGVVDGALYLKEDSEKFDLYFGNEENKILKLNAETATKLSTTRSIQINLGSTGQIVINDDGTCVPGRYCTVGQNGCATKTDAAANKYKVLQRVDNTHIKILFK